MKSERDELMDHLDTLSPGQLADGIIALQSAREEQLVQVHAENDALFDKAVDQAETILAVSVIHTTGYSGRCQTCRRERHPGPCETSVALGETQ